MGIDVFSLNNLILAVIAGYLLGSIPAAYVVSKLRGVNIFAIGTGLPGAANVYRNVGHKSGFIVFGTDLTKGVIAVLIGVLLGLEEPLIILPGLAAVIGHWKPVIFSFKGGDGYSTLLGITVALNPSYMVAAFAVGLLVTVIFILLKQTTSPAFWGFLTFFILLFGQNVVFDKDILMTLGIILIAAGVMIHAAWGYYSRGFSFRPWQSRIDKF